MNELNENADALAVQHYNLSLSFSEAGQFERAADELVQAAIVLERDEDWRKITGLWRATAATLVKTDPANLTIPDMRRDPYENFGTVEIAIWRDQPDVKHKIAWAYQWAAEHRLRADPASHLAYDLFLRSAYFAERTDKVLKEHDFTWPFHMYERALLNYVMFTSSFDKGDTVIKKSLDGLIRNAKEIEKNVNKTTAYQSMVRVYRNLRVVLTNTGNVNEARSIRLEESKYLCLLLQSSGHGARAVYQGAIGHRFKLYAYIFGILSFIGFPILYLLTCSLTNESDLSSVGAAIIYSLSTTLIIGNDYIKAPSVLGIVITFLQTLISYIALAVLVSRLTEYTSSD